MNVTPELLNKVTSGMANSGIQPKAEDVISVCDIAIVDQAQAIILLKKWPNWQDAVTHYFDNPIDALREQPSDRQWQTQDNIPFADDVGMSRPSSPNNRSFVDLTPQHAEASTQIHNEQQNEDNQLQQAMAASMKGMPGQESGTIGNAQHFGPAERTYYDKSQWSMVPIASSREVVEHPPPAKRRRMPGEPAFLRGSVDTAYNAALLTIYHSIPLAREALLFPPFKVVDYGHNSDWWAGTSDENTKALSVEDSTMGDEDRKKYLAEIQCLMAFLDNTSRAYGSVEALSDMRHFQHTQAEKQTTRMLEAWQTAAMHESPDQPLTQIFSSVAAQSDMQGGPLNQKGMVEMEGAVRYARTTGEVLDAMLWDDDHFEQPLDNNWVESFGQILTFRLFNDAYGITTLGLAPSETLYVDRYTPNFREALLRMRQRRVAYLREAQKLERARRRLLEMPGMQAHSPSTTVRKALESAKALLPTAGDDHLRIQDNLIDVEIAGGIDVAQIQSQLEALISEIDSKVQAIEQQKAELHRQTKTIMADLADPATSSMPLRQKYVLQGAATKANIIYVRKPDHDLIEMDDEDDAHQAWQWWRMAWEEPPAQMSTSTNGQVAASSYSVPYSVRKVSKEEVLHAVENESNIVMLVYADESAMDFQSSSLPTALRRFVEKDNQAFEDELSPGRIQQTGRPRSWSNETNSTAMDDDNPFDDNVYPSNGRRDATPMSTSTVRSLSGQPSPKRPRSSDDSMQDVDLMEDPPSYEVVAGNGNSQMSEKRGNKIGYFAEQLLQNVEDNEAKTRL